MTTRARALPAVAVIVATYVFFLLFAEFALLHLMAAQNRDPAALRAGLAFLGGGGVAGSLLAAWRHRRDRLRLHLALGFAGCALAAAGAAWPAAAVPLRAAAALTGLSLSWVTVNLAAALHCLFAGHRLGWWTGVATGGAYAFCNVPAVFNASPATHAWIGAGVALLGAAAAARISTAEPEEEEDAVFEDQGGRLAFWSFLGVLVALVWLDSAAFLVIQEQTTLRAIAWGAPHVLWSNAVIHFLTAALAGWLLDRGLVRLALGLAAADLLVACAGLAHGGSAAARLHSFYPAGVSIYSTVLVVLPALSRYWDNAPGGPWRAAWLYLLAGWIGSGLGIGMALDQRQIPVLFLVAAGAAVAGLLYLSLRAKRALAVLLVLGVLAAPERAEAGSADPVAAGRAVYIAEGCIHCHSQFVRPGTNDELWWGPARPLAESLAGEPPLPGNRRQGPDLQNVGNRRSPDWNRLHLENPRTFAPGSVMPSYRRLFERDDPRGPALVAYLASLGAETLEARRAQIAAWNPPADDGDVRRGRTRFARYCSACHGDDARGRGPVAGRLALPPADLVAGPFPRTTRDGAFDAADLARVIKFGVPGTAMAGHETLPDEDVAALTAYVAGLRLPAATR